MSKNHYNELKRKYQGTTHISAKKGEFAKTVLFPGDPLRAQWIAKKYLKNVKQINKLRGMLAFTGNYKGKKVSVMGSGMGIPSAAIYSNELFGFYGVKNIIRIGTCGAYSKKYKVGDLIASKQTFSESFIAKSFKLKTEPKNSLKCSAKLLKEAKNVSKKMKLDLLTINTHCNDNFYHRLGTKHYVAKNLHVSEMEAFAIYATAKLNKTNALTIATVVANHETKEELSPKIRESSLDNMVLIALEMAKKL